MELEQPPSDPAAAALRARIRARFAELHHEQQDKTTQLTALNTAGIPWAANTSLKIPH